MSCRAPSRGNPLRQAPSSPILGPLSRPVWSTPWPAIAPSRCARDRVSFSWRHRLPHPIFLGIERNNAASESTFTMPSGISETRAKASAGASSPQRLRTDSVNTARSRNCLRPSAALIASGISDKANALPRPSSALSRMSLFFPHRPFPLWRRRSGAEVWCPSRRQPSKAGLAEGAGKSTRESLVVRSCEKRS